MPAGRTRGSGEDAVSTTSGRAGARMSEAVVSRMTFHQRRVVVLCILLAITDGLDAQVLAYAAPHVVREYGFGASAFGVVFSASLVGMAIGSVVLGMAADRLGRNRVVLAATALFAAATLALPLVATDVEGFLATRFVAGLGLGGVTPVVISIIASNTSARARALAVMVAVGSLSLGAFVSGIVSAWMIPQWGWRSMFYFGGSLPLVIAALLFVSLRALTREQGESAAGGPRASVGGPVGELFRAGRAGATVTLWVVFFADLLVLFALLNWLPTLFLELGLSSRGATLGGAVFSLGGFAGGVLMGLLLGRTSRAHAVVSAGFGVGAIGILAVAFGPGSPAAMMIGVALAGGGVVGGLTGISALAVRLYPDRFRAAGVGWSYGVGRIGSIVGPVINGVLVAGGLGASSILGLAVVPALIACVGVVVLGLLEWRVVEVAPGAPVGATNPEAAR